MTGEHAWLGDSYCVTLVRDVAAAEVLSRLGGDLIGSLTLAEAARRAGSFDDGYPRMAVVARSGSWSVVLEIMGVEGSRAEVLRALSGATEVVAAFGTVGSCLFGYAVDGELVTAFDPYSPYRRWGTEPDQLASFLEGAAQVDALTLAENLTGVTLVRDLFAGSLPAAAITPLLDDPPHSVANHAVRQYDVELADAIDGADTAVQRQVAAAEARHLSERAGVARIPVVAEALSAAANGDARIVTDASTLGLLIRTWGNDAHTASASRHDPSAAHRMAPPDLDAAYLRATAGLAVRAALLPDALVACYQALSYLVTRHDPDIAERHAAVLRSLR